MKSPCFLVVAASCVGAGFLFGCAPVAEEKREHVTPAHRPRSYAHAVDEIERRHAQLRERMPAKSGDESFMEAWREQTEILSWMPEIAADSALSQKEWQDAVGAAREVDAIYQARGASGAFAAGDNDAIADALARLKSYVAVSERDRDELLGGGNDNSLPGETEQ